MSRSLQFSSESTASVRRRYYLKKGNVYTYFTESEVRCLKYLLQGKSYLETAQFLNLSVRTVEFYSQNMQAKLVCHNRASLIEFIKHYTLEHPLPWY